MADAKVQVQLVADTAKFEQDMRRATQSVKGASEDIKESFRSIREVAGVLGIGLGLEALVEGFKEIAKKTIDEERAINQLNAALITTGRSAGLTAKALSEISESLQKTSVFDDDAIRKATTALLAFRSVQGETFKEILRLAPDVATRLGKDLPEAVQILARAVEHPGEGLKALKQAGVEVSNQQIDLAQRLSETGDAAGSAKIIIDAVTRSFGGASEADTQGLYGATKRTSRAWDDLQKALGRKLFGDQGEELDKFAVQLDKIAHLIDHIGESRQHGATVSFDAPRPSDVEAAEEAAARVAQANEKARQEADKAYDKRTANLKRLADTGASFYANELHAAQHALAMESSAYDFAYSQNEKTIDQFYDHAKDAAKRSTAEVLENLRKQSQAAGEFIFEGRGKTLEEREAMAAKIISLSAQRQDVVRRDEERQLELDQKRLLALKQLGLAYDELAITVAEAEGRIGDAAAASFEKSQREQRKQFQAIAEAGGPGAGKAAQAVSNIDFLTRRQQTLGDLSAAEQKFGRTLQEVSNLQESIDLKAQAGALTTLDAMAQKEAIARRFIPVLEAEAKAYETLAEKSALGSVDRENAILQAQRLRLEIEKLGVAAEATGKMFTDIFVNSFTDGLTAIVTGTKSVKDAFHDMERSIVAAITRIAAQNIAEQLFGGKSGAGGGLLQQLGPWLANLFSPGTGPGVPQTGGPGGGLASGTDFWRGGPTWVGERGPEIVNLPRGAQVIPFNQAKAAGGTINIVTNISVPGSTSRATADQIGVQVGIAASRAMRRNS